MLIGLLIGSIGCSTIGLKKETHVVYVQMGQHDKAFDGQIRIATNKLIPVTVNNISTEFNAGGYYIIHEADLIALKNQINDQ